MTPSAETVLNGNNHRKYRRVVGTLILFLVSCVVAFGLGEIIVRVFFPQPMLPRYVTDSPYGIRVNMSNVSIWHRSPDYQINIRTNSHGIRADREIPYQKPSGVTRIVGLGDSFTLGYEVDLTDTYLYQLEQNLHHRGLDNTEVVNLGVSGFGTAEELIMLKEEGFRYSPDLVILGYFVNDIENNSTSNLYSLEGTALVRSADAYLPAVGIRKFLYAIPGYRSIADNSHLLSIFRNDLSWMLLRSLHQKRVRQEASRLGIAPETPFPEMEAMVNKHESLLTARLLDEIYLECSRRKIPLVILNIPTTNTLEKTMESNLPLDQMEHAKDIILVDAVTILKPFVGREPIQWERWHGHWRPWVHRLVATVLADTVARHLPIVPRPQQMVTPPSDRAIPHDQRPPVNTLTDVGTHPAVTNVRGTSSQSPSTHEHQ
jgi:hypothetical protein